MTQRLAADVERDPDSDSAFPPLEAASICSRPTPLIPPSLALRKLSAPAGSSDSPPELEARASSRPTLPSQPSSDLIERGFFEQAPPSIAPGIAPFSEPRRPPAAGRALAARLLFGTLFLGVVLLLGFALLRRASQAETIVERVFGATAADGR